MNSRSEMNNKKIKTNAAWRFSAVLALLLGGTQIASAFTFTTATTIGANDATYEGQDIVVDGAVVTIDGAHIFNSVLVQNGGRIVHSVATQSPDAQISITATRIEVGVSSYIDATYKGDASTAEMVGYAGGTYGGIGGVPSTSVTNLAYGDYRQPFLFGTGGKGTQPSYGGGRIKLVADELVVNGGIWANGSSGYYAGGGSGGSIWLDVGTLSGTGTISANGGTSTSNYSGGTGGGGGGRIAIYYDSAAGFDIVQNVTAVGGKGYNAQSGGAGTVFLKNKADSPGLLRIANNPNGPGVTGSPTPIAGSNGDDVEITQAIAEFRSGSFRNVSFDSTQVFVTGATTVSSFAGVGTSNTVTLSAALNVPELLVQGWTLFSNTVQNIDSLRVVNNGRIHHSFSSQFPNAEVAFVSNRIEIDASSYIEVTGRGNVADATQLGRTGGSYGGSGGVPADGVTNSTYGDYRQPVDYGTGGTGTYSGYRGGGRVRLVANELVLNGQINSNGTSTSYTGGGSGGSIWLDVGTLSGTGTIQTNGGAVGYANSGGAGGGGGGRVAVYYGAVSGFDLTTQVKAFGGNGYNAPAGAAGTVYLKDKAQTQGQLRIANGPGGPNSGGTAHVLTGQYDDPVVVSYARVEAVDATFASLAVANSYLTFNGVVTPASLTIASTTVYVKGTLNLSKDSFSPAASALYLSGQLNIPELIVDGWTLTIDTPQTFDVLRVINNGRIYHTASSQNANAVVDITANRIEIDATSWIEVSSRGLAADALTTGRSGGSHGGLGGVSANSTTNAVYGDFRAPVEFGTGGRGTYSSYGGGRVKLNAAELVLNGQIKADGYSTSHTGGGAGGSILLDVGALSGTGTIQANGGAVSYDNSGGAGGGGGGRVAVYYGAVSGFDLTTQVKAFGGNGYGGAPGGAAGTVYLKDKAQTQGQLRIANGPAGPSSGGTAHVLTGQYDDPVVVSYARVEAADATFGSLDVSASHLTINGTVTSNSATFTSTNVYVNGTLNLSQDNFAATGSWFYLTGQINIPEFVVNGGGLTVDTPQTFDVLRVINNGRIYHTASSQNANAVVDITANRIEIDATSWIEVSSRGLAADALTTGRSGGSHGGLGGVSPNGMTNAVYGDFRAPVEFGAGGRGTYSSYGGGRVKLTAAEFVLNGQIKADGHSTSHTGGGAGGSIWLDVGTLSGAGTIQANGGAVSYDNSGGAGGGGGGRVAVYYGAVSGFDLTTQVKAFGGNSYGGAPAGAAGTVYLKNKAQLQGQLRIANGPGGPSSGGTAHVLSGQYDEQVVVSYAKVDLGDSSFAELTINNSTVTVSGTVNPENISITSSNVSLSGSLNVAELVVDGWSLLMNSHQSFDVVRVINNGRIYHSSASQVPDAYLSLAARRVEVDSSSRIDATAGGLPASADVTGKSGGSYGGSGGLSTGGTTNATYGNYREPLDFGTGGAGYYYQGGGRIKVVADELVLNGKISSNGSSGGNNGGGGSGGSIWLDVGVISGTGTIEANGGSLPYGTNLGGGGGGRVAVYFDAVSGFDLTTQVKAFGGTGYGGPHGTAGTVYLKSKAQALGEIRYANGPGGPGAGAPAHTITGESSEPVLLSYARFNLIDAAFTSVTFTNANVNVSGTVTASQFGGVGTTVFLDGELKVPELTVNNWVLYADSPQQFDTLRVVNNGRVYHSNATQKSAAGINIEAGRIEVDGTSRIEATGRGFGPSAAVTGYAGGSYGGLGGKPTGSTTNPVYGDAQRPTEHGIGGHGAYSYAGGGRIKLTADELVVNGAIWSNGVGSSYNGGGSGGSIWLDVGVLSGTGTIQANGGDVSYSSPGAGGGGGGRIAIYYGIVNAFDIATQVQVKGGIGWGGPVGQAGTLHTGARTDSVAITGITPSGATATEVNEITVRFLTAIDPASFTIADDVQLTGSSGAIEIAEIVAVDEITYKLVLAAPLNVDGTYALTVGPGIYSTGGRGMDQDRDGTEDEPVDDRFVGTIVLDQAAPAAPVIINYAVNPAVNNITTRTITLEGNREDNTAVWINGVQKVALGSGLWSATFSIAEGNSSVTVHVTDGAGNTSDAVTVRFFVDSIAPTISSVMPANGSFLNATPTSAVITFVENGSGVNAAASTLQLTRNGSIVTGDWAETATTLTFTPSSAFAEGDYQLTAKLADNAGLQSAQSVTSFTIDTTAPAAPILDAVPERTNVNQQVISGNKEAYGAVYFNGALAVSHTAGTIWSKTVALTDGENILNFTVRDRAGNESAVTSTTIFYDNIAPGPVSLIANGEGDGTSVQLNWSSYDEVANGNDIAQYLVLGSESAYSNPANATVLATLPQGTKTYVATGLTRGTTYYFAVLARDAYGNGLSTVSPAAVTANDVQAPVNPSSLVVVSGQDQLELSWNAATDTAGDLQGYKVYLNSSLKTTVSKDAATYTITGLTPAMGYQVKVTSYDTTDNQSSGAIKNVATLLANPVVNLTEAGSGTIKLGWQAAQPFTLIKHYAIYVAETDYTSVEGLTPRTTVAAGQTAATLSGLINGTTYYVAVTTVNISDGETKSVTTHAITPEADITGPAVSNVRYGATALTAGATLSRSDSVRVSAADVSGVSYVELLVDGDVVATDRNGSTEYALALDLSRLTDGAHTLRVVAHDTVANETAIEIPVQVALGAPNAPTITSPANGTRTAQISVTVRGSAPTNTEVLVYNNGTQVAGPLPVDVTGAFQAFVTLQTGTNNITAAAKNRGGLSAQSAAVSVTLDTTIPSAPIGLTANARENGQVRLDWSAPSDSTIAGFNVYRSIQAFEDVATAVKINSTVITTGSYDDRPAQSGRYYYRVVSVNATGTASAPSNIVSVDADSIAPRVTSITYTTDGRKDAVTGHFGVGRITVTVNLSEPVAAAPFLSYTASGGNPMTVNLSRVSDLVYRGTLDITSSTASGTAYAVFSARDLAGNRGTTIDQGGLIAIDTAGPAVTALVVTPSDPVRNDSANPVTVSATFTLDQDPASGTNPQLSYRLASAGSQPVGADSIAFVERRTWRASFVLAANAGLNEAELLTFEFQAEDNLGNVGTRINTAAAVQIYQGDLPPLAVPANLAGKALAGGQSELTWQAVEGAVEYQLYRQGPAESALSAYQRVSATQFNDTPADEGAYRYSVASVRNANGQEALSGQSPAVEVVVDRTAPQAPQNLAIELTGAGMKLSWQAPAGFETGLSYRVYRSAGTVISDVSGLEPVKSGIVADVLGKLGYVDPAPTAAQPAYVVTAMDAAGNESAPSNSVYLNVDLLPVATLSVTQENAQAPALSWTHNAVNIAGYDVYIGDEPNAVKVNSALLTQRNYTDASYNGTARRYTIVAVDQNSAESLGRSILLPKVKATLAPQSSIKRGVMDVLNYTVANEGAEALSNVRLAVEFTGRRHTSETFNLAAGESRPVAVVVGGYSDLPALVTVKSSVEITPNVGELVRISRSADLETSEGGLAVSLLTESITRGGNGQVRFSLQNTSPVELELITARNTGATESAEIRMALKDVEGNVLIVQPMKQVLGEGVLTLGDGTTVARIAPGATFTSAPFALPVPFAVSGQVEVQLEIDTVHYHVGRTDHVAMDGLTTRKTVPLVETSYFGELTSITPSASFGDEPIVIRGRAIDRGATTAQSGVPLNVVISVNGFERIYRVSTGLDGSFSYTFVPQAKESGVYTVSIVHPDRVDRPAHGEFVISNVTLSNSKVNLNLPRNYQQTVSPNVTAGANTTLSNAKWEYLAADQANGELTAGITLDLSQNAQFAAGQSKSLPFTFQADDTAPASGTFVLRLVSDERPGVALAKLTLAYQLSAAQPVLYFTPNYLETGVNQGSSVTETLTLENRGLATMNNVAVSLLDESNNVAPGWIFVASASTLGNLAVSDKREVQLIAAPGSTIADGIYRFKLRVVSSNYPVTEINIFVAVTQSGIGSAAFKVSDIYTATLDTSGNAIQGLAGASLRLQHETVLNIDQTRSTDAYGEVLFTDLPTGWYKFRASAADHQEVIGRLQIKPGVTATKEIFLDFNLVTVEWSVTEVTLEDRYDVTLSTTFSTDVPAAVVVAEPAGVNLPAMAPGDVFSGEFTLTNYGLIRADNLRITPPRSDAYFRYEFLNAVPDSLQAKESVRIPYRVIALQALTPTGTDAQATGGGCGDYENSLQASYDYQCVNGTTTQGNATYRWMRTVNNCSDSPDTSSSINPLLPAAILSGFIPLSSPISGPGCFADPDACTGNCCKAQPGTGGGYD